MKKLIVIAFFVLFNSQFTVCALCGHSTDNVWRIIGGNETTRYEYPWMVYMEVEYTAHKHGKDETWYVSCGASLIDDMWIVTAAHCWDDYILDKGFNISVNLKLGAHNISANREVNQFHESAYKYFIHANYNLKDVNAFNDIALIKLRSKVDFTTHPHLQPICLPTAGAPLQQNECYISGWGYVNKQNTRETSVLMQAHVPIVEQTCGKVWNITDSQICAGGHKGGPDTCGGDSGGPLQCLQSNGTWILVGITSYGDDKCGAGDPTVYTRIDKYIDWINSVRSQNA